MLAQPKKVMLRCLVHEIKYLVHHNNIKDFFARDRSELILSAPFTLACFSIPIVAVLASKGVVVVLIILAAACLPSVFKGGTVLRAAAWRPLILVTPFLLWCFISSLWAVDPAISVLRCVSMAGLMLAGSLVVAGAKHLHPSQGIMMERAAIGGALCALTLIVGGLLLQSAFGHWAFGIEIAPHERILGKNGCTVLAVLTPILATMLWRQGKRTLAWLLAGAVAVFAYLMESHASIVALALGGLTLLAMLRRPRPTLAALQVAVAATVLLQPLAVAAMPSWENFSRHVGYLPNSAYHRYYIWKFVVQKIGERPLAGWGLDSSREMPDGGSVVMKETPVPWRPMAVGFTSENLPLHPHNVFLQWWLELGGIGAGLALMTVLWLLRQAGRLSGPPDIRAAAVGAIISGLVVSEFSYGAWQSWILSFHWLAIALFIALLWKPAKSSQIEP